MVAVSFLGSSESGNQIRMYTLRYYLMHNCTQLFNVLYLHTFTAGLFAFSSGCIVVVENLSDGQQRHLSGTSLGPRGTFNSQ